MSRTVEFIIPDGFGEKRLVAFLRGAAGFSYSLVCTLRHTANSMLRNGEPVRTIDRVNDGDKITVIIPDGKCGVEPVDYPLSIIYEDDDLLVIDKPADIAVHPSHGHQTDTLANGVAFYLQKRGHSGAFRCIGRLDKGTSGVIICALSTYSASLLTGSLDKTYLALCCGELYGSGTVDIPIYRPDPDKTLRACGESGERAVTHYEVLKSGNGMSLLRLKIETGRTHQIRVHLSHIGAPLVGDALYGTESDKATHHLLHCQSVELTHPVTKKKLCFTSPIPDDFMSVLRQIPGGEAAL